MSEEEKKAVELLKSWKDYKRTYYGNQWFKVEVSANNEIKQVIDTILNLIEKQQEENQNLKKGIARYKRKYNRCIEHNLDYIDNRLNELMKEYVPKSKIEKKIEELERKLRYEENDKVIYYIHKQIKVLKDLLESE